MLVRVIRSEQAEALAEQRVADADSSARSNRHTIDELRATNARLESRARDAEARIY